MNTREIARGGLLAGFAVVLLYIGGLIPQAAPALCISAGIVSAVPLIRSFALRTSLTVYAAVSALSLMLVPRKSESCARRARCARIKGRVSAAGNARIFRARGVLVRGEHRIYRF